ILYVLDVGSGKVVPVKFPDALCDVAVAEDGNVAVSCWDGKVYWLNDRHLTGSDVLSAGTPVGGPALLRFRPDGAWLFVAGTGGTVRAFDRTAKEAWKTDLNKVVPAAVKPWVANARATPIVPGLWQLPGGRVESDLGGQRLIEAPDGLILIEAHAG